MKFIPLASLALLMVAAAPAQSDKAANVENSSTQTAKADKADKADKDGKKVCRIFRNTGSNISDRICLTKEEWAQVEEEIRS